MIKRRVIDHGGRLTVERKVLFWWVPETKASGILIAIDDYFSEKGVSFLDNKIKCIDCGCNLYPVKVTNNVGVRRCDWICPQCGGGIVDVGGTYTELEECNALCGKCYYDMKEGPRKNCSRCGYVEKVGDNPKAEKAENAEALKTDRCPHGVWGPDYCHRCHTGKRPPHYAELVDELEKIKQQYIKERDELKTHIEYLNKENDKVARENISLYKQGYEAFWVRQAENFQEEFKKMKKERDELRERIGMKDEAIDAYQQQNERLRQENERFRNYIHELGAVAAKHIAILKGDDKA